MSSMMDGFTELTSPADKRKMLLLLMHLDSSILKARLLPVDGVSPSVLYLFYTRN